MTKHEHRCEQMKYAVESEKVRIDYVAKYREYGVRVLNGPSFIVMSYCPWCGTRLPKSLRIEWFDLLERIGIDPAYDKVPEEFADERWYVNRL